MKQTSPFLYIALTILFTVYGQLILKWRVSQLPRFPKETLDGLVHAVKLMFDPYVASGLFAAVLAALFWMLVLRSLDLSFAYPFMVLSFVFVMFLSALFFDEPITAEKMVGLILIGIGVYITSRSSITNIAGGV